HWPLLRPPRSRQRRVERRWLHEAEERKRLSCKPRLNTVTEGKFMNVKPIPPGHHTVTPYLAIKNGVKALEFYRKAFGATEILKLIMPDGRLGHAEIRLGDSIIMISDEFPEYGGKSPQTLGGTAVNIHLYVEDVDAFFKK